MSALMNDFMRKNAFHKNVPTSTIHPLVDKVTFHQIHFKNMESEQNKNASFANRTIALESNVLENLANSIVEKFVPLRQYLSTSFSFSTDLNKQNLNLTKEQLKIVKRVNANNFISLSKLKVATAYGWNCNLPDARYEIDIALKEIKNFNHDIVEPYYVYLSTFLTNKDGKTSSKDNSYIYKELEKKRIAEISTRAKLFSDDTNQGQLPLSQLVKRATDLQHVFDHINDTRKHFLELDFKGIKETIGKCVVVIDHITSGINSGNVKNIPSETALTLAAGAYEIAQQAEYITTTAFLVMNYIALGNTIAETLKSAEKEGML